MTEQQIIEAMIGAQRDYCVDDIGGLRNVDFAFEAMQAAYAVARAAVLDETAVKDQLAGKWLPIESAPIKGERVWTFGPHHRSPELRIPDGDFWRHEAKLRNGSVTTWMPQTIPPAPKGE